MGILVHVCPTPGSKFQGRFAMFRRHPFMGPQPAAIKAHA